MKKLVILALVFLSSVAYAQDYSSGSYDASNPLRKLIFGNANIANGDYRIQAATTAGHNTAMMSISASGDVAASPATGATINLLGVDATNSPGSLYMTAGATASSAVIPIGGIQFATGPNSASRWYMPWESSGSTVGLMYGDGSSSNVNAVIHANTTAGNDTSRVNLCGGGYPCSFDRGGIVFAVGSNATASKGYAGLLGGTDATYTNPALVYVHGTTSTSNQPGGIEIQTSSYPASSINLNANGSTTGNIVLTAGSSGVIDLHSASVTTSSCTVTTKYVTISIGGVATKLAVCN